LIPANPGSRRSRTGSSAELSFFGNLVSQISLIFGGGIAAVIFAFCKKEKKLDKPKGLAGPQEPVGKETLSNLKEKSSRSPAVSSAPTASPAFLSFAMLNHPSLLAELGRALLIILSLVVAGGFALILLPQPAVDSLADSIRARYTAAPQEQIALLYLADEIRNGEFVVRGVVRNITPQPIKQMEAAIRFYSHEGRVLRTTIVRMDKDEIAPDEIAKFELSFPNYKMEFASYAVEFGLRQGALVPYKEMRADPSSR